MVNNLEHILRYYLKVIFINNIGNPSARNVQSKLNRQNNAVSGFIYPVPAYLEASGIFPPRVSKP